MKLVCLDRQRSGASSKCGVKPVKDNEKLTGNMSTGTYWNCFIPVPHIHPSIHLLRLPPCRGLGGLEPVPVLRFSTLTFNLYRIKHVSSFPIVYLSRSSQTSDEATEVWRTRWFDGSQTFEAHSLKVRQFLCVQLQLQNCWSQFSHQFSPDWDILITGDDQIFVWAAQFDFIGQLQKKPVQWMWFTWDHQQTGL